jgi:NIPSNAP
MAAVIEVRTYQTQPGQRDKLMELLRTQAVPLHQELGMRILGPFPSVDDPDTFVWLRAFPDAASRDPMKEAFYGGRRWVEELEPVMMPLIAEYGAVVVEDTADLWDRWPEPSA